MTPLESSESGPSSSRHDDQDESVNMEIDNATFLDSLSSSSTSLAHSSSRVIPSQSPQSFLTSNMGEHTSAKLNPFDPSSSASSSTSSRPESPAATFRSRHKKLLKARPQSLGSNTYELAYQVRRSIYFADTQSFLWRNDHSQPDSPSDMSFSVLPQLMPSLATTSTAPDGLTSLASGTQLTGNINVPGLDAPCETLGERSSWSLSRNPSSSTSASSSIGPPTDETHLQTPFEPEFISSHPSFGQLYDLMESPHPASHRSALEKLAGLGQAMAGAVDDLDDFSKELTSAQTMSKRMDHPLTDPLSHSDIGFKVSIHSPTFSDSPRTALADLSLNMATLALLPTTTNNSDLLLPSYLPSNTSSDSESESTSSYFTAKAPESGRSSCRPSTATLSLPAVPPPKPRSGGMDTESAIEYHALSHDGVDQISPSRQTVNHRPARRRDSPPSAFRPPLSSAALQGVTDPGTPSSWVHVSDLPSMEDFTISPPETSPLRPVKKSRSLSLRAAPQPPRLERSSTSHRTRSSDVHNDPLPPMPTDSRPTRPAMPSRSSSFKLVLRRWSTRSSNTFGPADTAPKRSSSLPHASRKPLVPTPADQDVTPPSTIPIAKVPLPAPSRTKTLKKRQSYDDVKLTTRISHEIRRQFRIPLPRTSSLEYAA